MVSCPLQMYLFIGRGVDQHPVGLNVRISVSGPIEFERMIFVARRQGLFRE